MKTLEYKFKKIPILVSPDGYEGKRYWRCEISDNWEDYKPLKYKDVNFEDLAFHFHLPIYTDDYLFPTKREAIEAAKYVIENRKLNAKIWSWLTIERMIKAAQINKSPQEKQS